jgi:hypothetical protein
MRRRTFLSSLGAAPTLLSAQQGPPREERVESLTPGPRPTIALNHLGFLPKARKVLIVRATGGATASEFTVRDIGSRKSTGIWATAWWAISANSSARPCTR